MSDSDKDTLQLSKLTKKLAKCNGAWAVGLSRSGAYLPTSYQQKVCRPHACVCLCVCCCWCVFSKWSSDCRLSCIAWYLFDRFRLVLRCFEHFRSFLPFVCLSLGVAGRPHDVWTPLRLMAEWCCGYPFWRILFVGDWGNITLVLYWNKNCCIGCVFSVADCTRAPICSFLFFTHCPLVNCFSVVHATLRCAPPMTTKWVAEENHTLSEHLSRTSGQSFVSSTSTL